MRWRGPNSVNMIGQTVISNSGRHFELLEEIGRGAFGAVFQAKEVGFDSLFALKVITPMNDPGLVLSFQQEVESAAKVVHPNVLRVVDHGSIEMSGHRRLFAVSEFCQDGDYKKLLEMRRGQRLDPSVIISEFIQILSGLSALHSHIIHRDLKPANVLVSNSNLKIADFGIARFVNDATRTYTFKGGGTPYYMAPEVWLMNRASAATDLYSVGIMLYEAFVGNLPFVASDPNSLRDLHLYTPAPRAKAQNPHIPEVVDGIIKKLLMKEQAARYQTAESVIQDLALIRNIPASSPVVNVAERMRRHHDEEESKKLKQQQAEAIQLDATKRNSYMEKALIAIADEAVADLNSGLVETQIQSVPSRYRREFSFAGRSLVIKFFEAGELFQNPRTPGLMNRLHAKNVVHGGVIEIHGQDGDDREGWNVVLVRPEGSSYGEWLLIETRLSAISSKRARFEPFAVDAGLLAENLAYHWDNAMHIFILSEKELDKEDLFRMFNVLIP